MRNDYRHMVLDYYVERLREVRRRRREELQRIRRPAQALAYRRKTRAAVRGAFGPFPPRTPLDARVTGTVDLPACRLEKLAFDSRPGCTVTASLYLPRRAGRLPGVLAPCGHSEIGKAEERYQHFARRLAAAGMVVLLYEPFNQGERDQYARLPAARRGPVAGCCRAHNMMGKQMELLGDYYGAWRVWDGMRGLDYLLSRPEVDPRRLGVTGNSGGGTMSSWLWACDRRLTMAAPSCFSWRISAATQAAEMPPRMAVSTIIPSTPRQSAKIPPRPLPRNWPTPRNTE